MPGFHRKAEFRQKSIDEQLRSQLRWHCQNLQQIYGYQALTSPQPRQSGGNTNNGKNDKIGTNGRTEITEYRHPDPFSHFAHFSASQSNFFSCLSRTIIRECRAHDVR